MGEGAGVGAAAVAVTRVLLVRHAHAGDRAAWRGPDDLRPLSERGRAQAVALVALLAPYELEAVLSSPSLRCVQTVEPLAAARGLPIREADELLEGSGARETARWLARQAEQGSLAACTHGDIVPGVLDAARADGARVPDELRWAKGSTWVLTLADGRWRDAEYLPPPA